MGMKRCVLIGAAPNTEISGISRISPEDFILCADGGLEYAIRYGIRPDLVIGDFDSLSDHSLLNGIEFRRLPVEKDDTDTIAALRLARELGYSECLLLNGTGGRIDHTFANFSSLFFAESIGLHTVLIDGETEVSALLPGRYSLHGRCGWRLSLFAFGCERAEVDGAGVHYSVAGLTLQGDFPLGVSNEIESNDAWVTVRSGKILMMLEKM